MNYALRWRMRAPVPVILVSIGIGACGDIPTAAPSWDTHWVVPFERSSVALEQFLPDGVDVAGTSFEFELDPASFGERLGELCPPCAESNHLPVTKPAFQGTFAGELELPEGMHSALLRQGEIDVTLTNGFNFDPIRPAAGAHGVLVLTLVNAEDGRVLSSVPIDGDDTAFPPGETLARTLPLGEGDVGRLLSLEILVDSPEGELVLMQASREIRADAESNVLRARSAGIDLSGVDVDFGPVLLDVREVDDRLVERVRRGRLLLDVDNDLDVVMTMDLRVSGTGALALDREASFGPGATSENFPLTGSEVRSFLRGRDVTVSGLGRLSPQAGIHVLSPSQAFAVGMSMEIAVSVGGDPPS